jgi:hypothetical protein
MTVSPNPASGPAGGTHTFQAAVTDQFGGQWSAPVAWSVDAGGAGAIDAATGVYTAPAGGRRVGDRPGDRRRSSATAAVTVTPVTHARRAD